MNPLVTVALFAYNQEDYIVDAVRSVLAQDYSPLQIIISDDCSTDATFSKAEKLVSNYDGPHRVLLNRNEKNLGVGGHVNKIMEVAEGELIVAAGGDDISVSDRVTETVNFWVRSGKKYRSICSQLDVMNEPGEVYMQMPCVNPVGYGQALQSGARWMYGASHAWHRSLFEIFGPLRDDVVSEDKSIGFRSLLIGQKVGCVEKPLVQYRYHSSNITNGSTNIERVKQKIATYNSYLDDFNKARVLGYLRDTLEVHSVYQDVIRLRDNFVLRKKILTSGLLQSLFLLLTAGNRLSMQQKKGLFLKKVFDRS